MRVVRRVHGGGRVGEGSEESAWGRVVRREGRGREQGQ